MTASTTMAMLVLLPVVIGAVLACSGKRADRAAAPIAIGTAALVTALAVGSAFQRPSLTVPFLDGLPLRLAVDGLGAVFVVLVAAVTLVVLVFAHGDLGKDEARARFFGLMLLFSGAMLITVTAGSLLPLLIAWEVMGATSYALIGFWWHEQHRAEAATVAFVTTRAADLGFYLAVAAAYAGSRSLDVSALADLPTPYLHVVAAGLLVAAAGKSAQLPFAFWLSRAMAGPSPVSALLHSATMVAAGAFLLLRIEPLLDSSGWGLPVAVAVGLSTAVALGLVAIWQRDLKQLLAASTSAQMGLVFVAAGTGSVAAGTLHLVTHAATKSLLFLAAGAWLTGLGTQRLAELGGAGRRMPAVGVPFAIGALSLAGVPPLAMWVSKDEILGAALTATPLLWIGALITGALSAAYAGLALGVAWAPRRTPRVKSDGWSTIALAGLAVATVVLAGLGLSDPAELVTWAAAAASALAIAIAAWAAVRGWRSRLPRPSGPLARWLNLERAARALVWHPVLRLAHLLARFDDRIVDGAVHAAGRGLVSGAQRLRRRFEDPVVDGTVEAVANAARGLGRLARRPQTGQLHQYYAQAVLVLVALLVIVLVVR
jgi:NADH:ubiquinone oxidoreductase subunit 5 (subunit L)/multisubunit Na+/H+ antiporter MnhA subunit